MTKLSLMLIYLTRSTLCKFFTPLRGNRQRIGLIDLNNPNFSFYSLFSFQNEENFNSLHPLPKINPTNTPIFWFGNDKNLPSCLTCPPHVVTRTRHPWFHCHLYFDSHFTNSFNLNTLQKQYQNWCISKHVSSPKKLKAWSNIILSLEF